MIALTVTPDAAGQRLDKYVRRALKDVPLSHLYKMFRTRKVKVNGVRGKAEQLLAEGDKVEIWGDEQKLMTKPEPGPGGARRAGGPRLEILFEVSIEGILTMSARDLDTGRQMKTTVRVAAA